MVLNPSDGTPTYATASPASDSAALVRLSVAMRELR
jgi:hypothetical protein